MEDTITLEATPCAMGWTVDAIVNNARHNVARGLIDPGPTLEWCKNNPDAIRREAKRLYSTPNPQ